MLKRTRRATSGQGSSPGTLLLLCALLSGLVGLPPACSAAEEPAIAPAAPVRVAADRVQTLMDQMSLEQKVGQLLLVYFEGPALSPDLQRLICEGHAGGIVLFSSAGNIQSVEQVTGLIAQAQQAAIGQPAGVPLFVAVDQEGGAVARLRRGVAVMPGQMALAAGGSIDKAAELYRITAQQLAALGINMNLAPVLDVNTNPNNPIIGTRSFGSDPEQVAAFGRAAIVATQAAGVVATAKHFPGHGDTDVDSHVGLPVLGHDRSRLDAIELVPFRAAIAADVDAIMTGHLLVPAIDNDPTRPATLSPNVITGLLRNDLGFHGLVVSDAMGMKALTQSLPLAEAAVRAIQAGVDVLSFGGEGLASPADQMAVHARLVQAVQSGEIPMSRLDDAVRRILATKQKRGILDRAIVTQVAADGVGNEGQTALASMAYDDSITLLRDDAGLLPIKPTDRVLVLARQSPVVWGVALAGCPNEVNVLFMPAEPSQAFIDEAVALAATADKIVIATHSARSFPGQLRIVAAMPADRSILISMSGPYDVSALMAPASPAATDGPIQNASSASAASALLLAYDGTEGSVRAVSRALLGQIVPTGRLPVTLEGLFPRGYRFGE